MKIRLRSFSAVLLFVLILSGASRHATYLEAGEILYYDKNGNRVSKEKYLELTGQQKKSRQIKDAPAVKERTEDNETSLFGEEQKIKSSEQKEDLAPEKSAGPGITPLAGEEQKTTPPPGEALSDAAGSSEGEKSSPEEEIAELQYQASISSSTLFRAFRRNTSDKDDVLVMSAYEYLRVDFGALEQSGLSMHLYGWGRYDFNDSGFYRENPDGEVLYGYIEYTQPEYGFNVKLGRQHSFEGVINDSIDGLGIKSALTPYFAISLYGGSPVELESDGGRSEDSFLGGRISAHPNPRYEIGFSYKQKYSQGDVDEKIAGIDLSAILPGNATLQGLSAYNLDTKGWGEHTYEAGFDIFDFHLRPLYQRYQYKDFFNTGDSSADPFRFLSDTGEILTVLGGEVIWRRLTAVDLGAKVKHYTYDLRNDNALYYEGNLTWYLDGRTQIGGQFGRMDGESAETCYLLSRVFFYWHTPFGLGPLGFITGDVVYVHYDEDLFGKNRSLFLSLGSGLHFLNDALEVKLSGDYSEDPFFDSDTRGLLVVTYTY